MGDLSIQGAAKLPPTYSSETVNPTFTSKNETPGEKKQPLGKFLQKSLSELRQLTLGSAKPAASNEAIAFATADAFQALRISHEFLSIHEQHA